MIFLSLLLAGGIVGLITALLVDRDREAMALGGAGRPSWSAASPPGSPSGRSPPMTSRRWPPVSPPPFCSASRSR